MLEKKQRTPEEQRVVDVYLEELKARVDAGEIVELPGKFTHDDLDAMGFQPEYRTGPLTQSCWKCGKEFEFPEGTSVTSCPHCGADNTPR
jgi:hypothetical protein